MKAMRRMRILPVLLALSMFLVVFINACAGPPEALMTASVTAGQAPLSATFTNNSKNADEYRWDFGDGATATTTKEKKTTHEYTKAGAHAVTLTAVKKGEPPQTSTASINITVEPGPLDRVKIEPPVTTLEVTGELKFTPTALDRFDNPIPGLSYTFRSDEKAGKVDSAGKFTAGAGAGSYENGLTVEVAQGTTAKTATAKVTVKPGPLDRVKIEPGEAAVEVSGKHKFAATALDRFDNPIPDLSYTFRSDKGAGQVTSEGGLTAGTKAGVYPNGVTVEATQGSVTKTATAPVTVRPGPLDSVKLEPDAATLEVVNKQKFAATALDQFDNPIPGLNYAFRSQEGAGRVEQDGEFTAGSKTGSYPNGLTVEVAQGAVTRTATARLTLRPGPLNRVILSPPTATLDIDKTQQFRVEATDLYRNPIPEAKVTWQVAGQVGTIDEKGLLRTGTKAGTFGQGIKATASLGRDSKEGTATVTIKPGPAVVYSIPPLELAAGEAQQVKGFVADRYGNPVGDAKLTFTAGETNAGSLSAAGLLTAGKVVGKYEIPFKGAPGLTAPTSIPVTIKAGPLERMVIAPNPADIGIGNAQRFVAVGADQYGNRIAGLQVTWSMEAGGGAIAANGRFIPGTRPGTYNNTVKATATQGSITRSATASVKVEPDRIAFISDQQDNQPDVYTMNLDGTNIQRVTKDSLLEFVLSWSPDGRRILYTTCVRRGEQLGCGLILMNDDGGWPTLLQDNAFEASWSRDGSKIAFVSTRDGNRKIYLMDVAGGNVKRLTNTSEGAEYVPAWSPNGKKIVYDHTPKGGRGDIWVMDADGSNKRQLTDHPGNDTEPSFSPDGSQILFVSDRDGDSEIYVMNADGSNVRQLTFNNADDANPSWSPDGKQIVFASDRDLKDKPEIYVMNADGTNLRRLTTNSADDSMARWAPRKRGVEVSEASVVVANASALKPITVQEVTAEVRPAVVRIKTDAGGGSGFVIDPNGLILTANHVITDAKDITVTLDDKRSFKGRVLGRDMVRDLAIVKIEATNLPTVELGDVSQMSLGSWAVVVAYPLDSTEIVITQLVTSAIRTDPGRNILWVQTDRKVNPGSSGGPLLDLQGQVIGVVSEVREDSAFAISANTVKLYLDRLKAGQVIAN